MLYQIPDSPFRALANVVPGKIVAGNHGVHGIGFSNQSGPSFIYYETVAGGGGARTTKDGIDGVHCASNLPLEAMEMAFPIIADRLEYIQDSEGAGKFRGGLGIQKEFHMIANNYLSIHSNRHKFPAAGLHGGRDAIPTKVVRNPHSEEPEIMPRQGTFIPANTDTVMTLMVGGGGGYGHPFERDPELVLWDVVNDKVSQTRAKTMYGVALDLENRRVDQDETKRLRSKHSAS
jgi:N-methylhydantoinase B